MSPPNNSLTEDRVKLMIIDGLKEYERKTVEPRHRETQGKLTDIENLIQKGRGMMMLGGGTLTIASLVWIVLQIVHHINEH